MEKVENICLDTNVLIDFLRNKKEALDFIKEHEVKDALATTIINIFELYYGAFHSSSEKNLLAVQDLQRRIKILSFSTESAESSARILINLESSGNATDFRDLLIGVISLNNGFAFKTGNKKHFSGIPNLILCN